jgi:uncharacterized membrane protein
MQLGKLHVVLVHLPIALMLAAGAADLLWAVTRRKFFDNPGLYCLLAAMVTTPLAVLTGDWLLELEFGGKETLLAERHELAGYVALGLITAAAILRVLWRVRGWRWLNALYVLIIVAAVVTILIAGHLGGLLSHGETFFAGFWAAGICFV